MGSDYLIDTNTIIYLLDKKLSPTAEVFIISIIDEACQLSIISQIELLSWLLPDQEANDVLEKFIADCQIVGCLLNAYCQRTCQKQ